MLIPQFYNPSSFGDEVLLRSVDFLENFPWNHDHSVQLGKDKFEINLNVKDFGPKDVTVKIEDGFIIIDGKHEEKQDKQGWVARHFTRKYVIPEDCVLEKVESKLSADGVLTVTAPLKQVVKRDIVIPVTHENRVKSKL